MFTGLIEAVGVVRSLQRRGPGGRLEIDAALEGYVLGESIAVSGACLTVAHFRAGAFEADVSAETLARTTLGGLRPGARVNLERSLRLGDRMGGHVVLGHVDAVAAIEAVEEVGGARRVRVRAPAELARYLAEKGSVCLDGASLTINAVHAEGAFELMLVPHTLGATTLAALARGDRCNLEVDVLARYVGRQLEQAGILPPSGGGAGGGSSLLDKLAAGGFL